MLIYSTYTREGESRKEDASLDNNMEEKMKEKEMDKGPEFVSLLFILFLIRPIYDELIRSYQKIPEYY